MTKNKNMYRRTWLKKSRKDTLIKIFRIIFSEFTLQLILLILVNIGLIEFLRHIDLQQSFIDLSKESANRWFIFFSYLIIIIPSLLYVINICYHIIKQHESENIDHFQTEIKSRYQHFYNLVSLLLFYSSILIFLVLFIPKPPIVQIPKINPGTFGIRAWSCQTIVKDLEVFYQDSNNNWKKISKDLLYDEANWVDPNWSSNNNRSFDVLFKSKNFLVDQDKEQIILNRTGIIFIPKNKSNPHYFKNVKMSGNIVFDQISAKNSYPGFQFCINVDTTKSTTENDTYSEYYLAFDYLLFHESKPWIPLIHLYPSVARPTSMFKLREKGLKFNHDIDNPKYKYSCKLSAFRIDNQVRFSFHDKNSTAHTLFDAKINEAF